SIMSVFLVILLNISLAYGAVQSGPEVRPNKVPQGRPSNMSNPKTDTQDESAPIVPSQPVNCEDFQLYLDQTILRWRTLQGTYLFIIVRLGAHESNSRLNRYRIDYISDYLKRHEVQYIAAEGSRVKGLGTMEFYIGGKLALVVPIKLNARRLCLGTT